jgi:hypothetical protein
VLAREQRDDPVGLTQLVGAQHDRLVTVERHLPILLGGTDKPGQAGRSMWVVLADPGPGAGS